MAAAATVCISRSKELAMHGHPSPSQSKPASPDRRPDAPVQTGALPGGQPGQGVDTSSSAPGQSNVDAAIREGTEYGKHERPKR